MVRRTSRTSQQSAVPDHTASLRGHWQRGFLSMRFDSTLESRYRDDQFRDSQNGLRANLIILVGLVFVIMQVDRIVSPELAETIPNFTWLGALVLIPAVALALSFVRTAPVWYPRIITVLMAVALMGIAWIGLLAWSRGEDRMFVRLIIATMAVYFVMGLRFRLALGANAAGVAFYVAAAVLCDMPSVVLAQFLAMLLMTNVICAAGAYNLEHAQRTAWLEGSLLAEVALSDSLTGIPNRRRLDEQLQQVWQQGLRERKPVSLLFSDIDYFKAYNDHYGHQAGDSALRAVAAVHARFGRRPLDTAARFGGEEFAIVLYDTDRGQALRVADEIMKDVRDLNIPHAKSGVAPTLSISIGLACMVPTTHQSSADLLQLADQALYAAKDSGRNRIHVMDAKAKDRSPTH